MDRRIKRLLLIFLGILGFLALVFVLRFILGGPEDTWICSAGGWIKHGNPLTSMPTLPCT